MTDNRPIRQEDEDESVNLEDAVTRYGGRGGGESNVGLANSGLILGCVTVLGDIVHIG